MGGNATTEHINETMNKEVSEPRPIAAMEDLKKAIPIRDSLRYVKNDTYVADVSAILGRIYYEHKNHDELLPFYISLSASVDPTSKLTAPQTISELIIDTKAKAKVEALAYLSSEISSEELLEVRVINNATARFIERGEEWESAILKWLNNPLCQNLINNPKVGSISVVTGVVQKYLTVKKYKKFEAGAKGGAFGVNVEGNLYTSTSQFELTVVYGLDLVTFKEADDVNKFMENISTRALTLNSDELSIVNKKFDKMSSQRASIFRLNPGEDL